MVQHLPMHLMPCTKIEIEIPETRHSNHLTRESLLCTHLLYRLVDTASLFPFKGARQAQVWKGKNEPSGIQISKALDFRTFENPWQRRQPIFLRKSLERIKALPTLPLKDLQKHPVFGTSPLKVLPLCGLNRHPCGGVRSGW